MKYKIGQIVMFDRFMEEVEIISIENDKYRIKCKDGTIFLVNEFEMSKLIKDQLNTDEFNKRCHEVFNSQDGDYYYAIDVKEDGRVVINMEEETAKGETVTFDFEPNMKERPQALDYLLGNRDDFND